MTDGSSISGRPTSLFVRIKLTSQGETAFPRRTGPVLAALLLLVASLAGARALSAAPSPVPRPSGQYGLPFAAPPGPDTWLLGQFYGNTTFAYAERATQYQYGQGLHFGLDFTAACGTPVVAITDAVVSQVDGPHGSPPHNLVIDHPDGLSSLYGHLLQKPSVTVGQHVRRGEVVALSGDSQRSCESQPHLHLEIRDHTHLRLFDPIPYLKADWAALSLVDPDVDGPAFEQNLGQPGAWQFVEDQPAVHIGGPPLNAYPRAWPPLAPATPSRYGPVVQAQGVTLPGGSVQQGRTAGSPAVSATGTGGESRTPYTVQKGDTLYHLAQSVGLTVAQLQALTGLTPADVKVGQVLALPSAPGSPAAQSPSLLAAPESPPPTPPPSSPAAPVPYTVQPGDTLYHLAQVVGLTVTQLQVLNGLTSVKVAVGQVLELPSVSGSPPLTPASSPPAALGPAVRTAVRISRPGCCVNAQWTPDSAQLRVLDGPPGGAVGLYRLPADGSAPGGVFERAPALISPDGAYTLEPLGPSSALAQRLADGARARVPTSGGGAVWSPGGQLAWATYGTASRDDWIPMTVFVNTPFSTGAGMQRLPTVYGGRLIGWLDATTVLLTGRLIRTDARRAVLKIDVPSGAVQVLARGAWLSGVQVSPDGRRVVYRVTLDAPGHNGMFVVDTGTARVVPLTLFGSARWQDPDHLLLIPFEPGQAGQRLVQLDVGSGGVVALFPLPGGVAHDDWQVAPDGRRMVYLSQTDHALQVLTLPVSETPPLGAAPARSPLARLSPSEPQGDLQTWLGERP